MTDSNNRPGEREKLDRISAPDPATPSPRAHFAPAQYGGNSIDLEDDKPRRSPGKVAGIVAGALAGALLVAYGAGFFAFSNIYYPNTSIAGVDVSLMNKDTAASRVRSSATNYKLTISGRDFQMEYKPESSDMVFDADARAADLLGQNDPIAWPIHLFESLNPHHVVEPEEVELSDEVALPEGFDKEGFDKQITAAVKAYNKSRSGTFDGKSAYDEERKAFSVDKALSNVRLDRGVLETVAKLALNDLISHVELPDEAFMPLVKGKSDAEIAAACQAANELVNIEFDLTMAGQKAATVNQELLAPMVIFDKDLKPTIDKEALIDWGLELDDNLDTVGTKRTYRRADGKRISVSGGTWGWITNSKKLANAIVKAVDKRSTDDVKIPLKQKGDVYNGKGERDWGAYIDIDLEEQYARYYNKNDKVIWESGVITGNPNQGNETPTGIYSINQPLRNITLIGEPDPKTGEPIYKTPVSYWMPFIGSIIGLHDAGWQASSSFSDPSAYTWTGSHGCVNLPPAKAKKLYGMIEPGLCVIVHW